jgi:outer membrane protein TolC
MAGERALRSIVISITVTLLTEQLGVAQPRRITLQQAKDLPDPAKAVVSRLGQLSVEAAKQHRLGVRADYFPKFGATFLNLHYTDFLGQVVTVRRPLIGSATQFPIPLFSKDQTLAALTFTQPITPLLQVRQAVKMARADERIAMAKAAVPIAKNVRDREIEQTYFKLLIAQHKLTAAQLKSRQINGRILYAAASSTTAQERSTEFMALAIEAKQLTASLNRLIGWPDDTELDLDPPEPLVENISLEEVSNNSAAVNPDVVEAEQTLVKARAAVTLSKLEYVPTVAAVSGYAFQNVIPAVPSNFGYGGVVASYNLFDFGKRERTIKEARAKAEMAEIVVQMTKAKVTADIKKSFYEVQHCREVSNMVQRMRSSMAPLMNISANADSIEVKAARTEMELQTLEADFAHRLAYAHLGALMGPAERDQH